LNAEFSIEARIGSSFVEALFSSTDQGFCVCEILTAPDGRPRDYRFLAVNAVFEEMTGLYGAEGSTALGLVPNLEPFWIETYGQVALEGVTRRFQSGSEAMGRWFDVFAAPIEPHGRFAIFFRDITRERRLEQERREALDRAEALIDELNHRVMNSLGMIVSIIRLEARGRAEGEGRRALERIAGRVGAVGDLYRCLAASKSETAVQADVYLGEIVAQLGASLAFDLGVELHSDIAPLALPTGVAAPLGLIVTELVTNSLKYAFPEGGGGRVTVSLAEVGNTLRLTVRDDGRGMPEPAPDGGIGRMLVDAFARQLEGAVETDSSGGGTSVTVSFPAPPHA
jgi:two-component sensor histidine kinase